MSDKNLEKAHLAYIAKLKENGVPVVSFSCPVCALDIETKLNTTNTDWDSVAACYGCESLYMKITSSHGRGVKANAI